MVAALGRIAHDHGRLILVNKDTQLVAARPLIIHFEGKVVAEPALDSEIVLVQIRAAYVLVFGIDADEPHGGSCRSLLAYVRDQRHTLIQRSGIRKLVGLSATGGLRRGQSIGRIQSHVGRDVVEDFVISHAESGANHGSVIAKQRLAETRRICNAHHGREVVLVRVHSAVAEGERSLTEKERVGARFLWIDVQDLVRPEQHRSDARDEIGRQLARLVNR